MIFARIFIHIMIVLETLRQVQKQSWKNNSLLFFTFSEAIKDVINNITLT